MRANLIGLAVLLAVFSAALLRAEPAKCELCQTGATCYNNISCFSPCRCILPNGVGKPGFCG